MAGHAWVDIAIVAVIGASGLIGLVRGLIREVISLGSWGASVWVGLHYNGLLVPYFEAHIPLASARVAVAFAILFLGTLLVAALLGFVLRKLVEGTGLTAVDRFFGLFFGTARGVLVVAVLVLLGGLTPLPSDPWWTESKLIPPFQNFAYWLRGQIPPALAGYFNFSLLGRH